MSNSKYWYLCKDLPGMNSGAILTENESGCIRVLNQAYIPKSYPGFFTEFFSEHKDFKARDIVEWGDNGNKGIIEGFIQLSNKEFAALVNIGNEHNDKYFIKYDMLRKADNWPTKLPGTLELAHNQDDFVAIKAFSQLKWLARQMNGDWNPTKADPGYLIYRLTLRQNKYSTTAADSSTQVVKVVFKTREMCEYVIKNFPNLLKALS